MNILSTFYASLVEHFKGDGKVLEDVELVYLSLWCKSQTKTGTTCKSRAVVGGLCTRHARPKCRFILSKGKNKGMQCSRFAVEGGVCKQHASATCVAAVEPEPEPEPKIAAVEPEPEPEPKIAAEITIVAPSVKYLDSMPAPRTTPFSAGCLAALKGGLFCGKPIELHSLFCKRHLKSKLTLNALDLFPRVKWERGSFWDDMVKGYNWPEMAASVVTRGTVASEIGCDDSEVDWSVVFPRRRVRSCGWVDTSCGYVCSEPLEGKRKFCDEHKTTQQPYVDREANWGENKPMGYVTRAFPECLPYKPWSTQTFPNLNITALTSRQGPIAVGKSWQLDCFAETLTHYPVERCVCYRDDECTRETDELGGHSFEDDEALQKHLKRCSRDNDPYDDGKDSLMYLKRCENNGLLYKVLDQQTLRNLPFIDPDKLDELPGAGFLSFEQMIRDRPTLYIKYWNIWKNL
jgi:hypothetical protein